MRRWQKPINHGRNRFRCLHRILPAVAAAVLVVCIHAWKDEAADLLAKGDSALSKSNLDQSIQYYLKGIQALPPRWSSEEGFGIENGADKDEKDDGQPLPDGKEMEVILSLHTNYGTALSYSNGGAESILSAYRTACLCYGYWKRRTAAQSTGNDDAIKAIATQSYFFLGMTYQDLASANADKEEQEMQLQQAGRSYAAATKIDPNHWSSFANMGVVLADVGIDHGSGSEAASLGMFEEGIMAYQAAISILTGVRDSDNDKGPTDPPENVREVVSELHYRIGLSLVPFLFAADDGGEDYSKRQCTLSVGPSSTPTTRSCLELSAFQFQTALQFHPDHEGASGALTFATADATFGMSTDVKKVQNLFEEYAPTFEHSLVDELGYNGFHRMRRSFDRAMVSEGLANKKFPLVIDAGCGTGLAGEVFRNISQTLIGVDLSQTIIDLAKKTRPNLYTEFKSGDIKEVIRQHEKQVSLLVAADTFIYFNDLSDLFAAMQIGLEEGGYAIFSLENVSVENERRLSQLKPDWRWQLTPSGRVAHRKEYVEGAARAQSLEIILYEKLDDFRKENGRGVRGHMFVLQKRTRGGDEL